MAVVYLSKELTLGDIRKIRVEISQLRKELRLREGALSAINMQRVNLYKACRISRNPQADAMRIAHVSHETLPEHIMQRYG
jgi:hypothetical protein